MMHGVHDSAPGVAGADYNLPGRAWDSQSNAESPAIIDSKTSGCTMRSLRTICTLIVTPLDSRDKLHAQAFAKTRRAVQDKVVR